ncbi:MAG TPA: ParB/RepB/Spo0J family partition protein, partial [Limnochordia bacterium]
LGRGLKALIEDAGVAANDGDGVRLIALDAIRAGRHQPRRRFAEAPLEELAASIREHGVLEPVIVRPVEAGYELVVGERRWRAAQLAGVETVPAIVREMGEREAMELALVENLQREDLNPLEEAEAYRRLMAEFGLTQEEVAARVGRQRPTIANRIRLLELHPQVQELVASGALSAGHAKALLGLPSGPEQVRVAEKIAAEGLSVRAAEALVRRLLERRPARRAPVEDPVWREVEERLQSALGTRVRIRRGKGGRGRIEIEFYGDEDVERIVEAIAGAV